MELRAEDLYLTCPRCNGTGQFDERDGNHRRYGPCPDCDAKGSILTESGKVLAEFIWRFQR
jgi:DnaJ-class molecular chaperone